MESNDSSDDIVKDKSNALRDLSKIQSLKASKQSKPKPKSDDSKVLDLMKIVTAILREQPNHKMESNQLDKQLRVKHNIKRIKRACGKKRKTFYWLMEQKNLIKSKPISDGNCMIKLINFDESEFDKRINKKINYISKWELLEKTHHKQIDKLCKRIVKILSKATDKEMDGMKLMQKLSHKFGKNISKEFFDTRIHVSDMLKYLQNVQKIITFTSSADGQCHVVKLISDEPPLKRRKLNKFINDYNNRNINEKKLTENIVKNINKLEEKHEIHFHFVLKMPELNAAKTKLNEIKSQSDNAKSKSKSNQMKSQFDDDIDLSDSEMENDEYDQYK